MKILKIILFLLPSVIFAQCPPDIQVQMTPNSKTLTCNNPTLLATGSSSTANTVISWLVPSTPSLINSSSVIVGPPNGPPTTTSSLVYANYTVVATNTLLGCTSSSVIQINQNFRGWDFELEFSVISPTAICDSTHIFITTSSTISQWPPITFQNPCWQGPPAFTPTCGIGYIKTLFPGTYSLTVSHPFSGCQTTRTISVADNRPQFSIYGVAPTSSLNCNGLLTVNPQNAGSYSLTASQGSIDGLTIYSLCYGWVKFCLTENNSSCFKCDSVLINEATGLTEQNIDTNFKIYPNPAKDILFFESSFPDKLFFEIYNLDGKLLRVFNTQNGTQINVSEIPPGVYFIKPENTFLKKKLVIMK